MFVRLNHSRTSLCKAFCFFPFLSGRLCSVRVCFIDTPNGNRHQRKTQKLEKNYYHQVLGGARLRQVWSVWCVCVCGWTPEGRQSSGKTPHTPQFCYYFRNIGASAALYGMGKWKHKDRTGQDREFVHHAIRGVLQSSFVSEDGYVLLMHTRRGKPAGVLERLTTNIDLRLREVWLNCL
jgi:hypothetical protein